MRKFADLHAAEHHEFAEAAIAALEGVAAKFGLGTVGITAVLFNDPTSIEFVANVPRELATLAISLGLAEIKSGRGIEIRVPREATR